MDKNSVDWRGHWVALVTPFDAAGNVDEAAFRLNVEQCISTVGVAGLVPCGCTGEFWAQTNEERKRVIKACVETAAGRVPVVAGTGAIRTADVIELSDSARQAGCACGPFYRQREDSAVDQSDYKEHERPGCPGGDRKRLYQKVSVARRGVAIFVKAGLAEYHDFRGPRKKFHRLERKLKEWEISRSPR